MTLKTFERFYFMIFYNVYTRCRDLERRFDANMKSDKKKHSRRKKARSKRKRDRGFNTARNKYKK